MKSRPFTKSIKVAGLSTLLLLLPTLGFVQGCTDLTEVPTSSVTPENFYKNEAEVLGALASVYAQLRSTTDAYYNVTEVSSDEYIVPTRGTDWFDGGRWLELDRQLWGANSPTGLDDLNGAWLNLFSGVARANGALAAVDQVTFPDKAIVQAELRTLRAFYYFLLQDLFGGVPIVETTILVPPKGNTRAEVFNFIESELNATRAVLPPTWPADMHGRMTKGAADAILASLYLNARVFTGTVSVTGLAPGAARWQDAVDVSDRIINSAVYSLATNATAGCSTAGCGWRSNFTFNNHLSPEIILTVKFLNTSGLGLNFLHRALHYNQYDAPQPWNGFATIAETFAAFDPDDQRRQIFLEGRAFNVVTGLPVNDRAGNPLFFDPNIGDPTQASEGAGVRITKWPVDPGHIAQDNGNDVAHFRLADIYLIKAEALNELGRTAEAIVLVNQIRARVFAIPEPVPATTQAGFRDVILRERLFELTAESKRRQDLIRHNKFLLPWFNKQLREPYRILMPIPQPQRDANPNLAQNAGY